MQRVTQANVIQVIASLSLEDQHLVSVLYDLRYLRANQVQVICYPHHTYAFVQQRLWRLMQRGVISNIKLREEASTVAYWHLGQLGLRIAETLNQIENRTPLRDWTTSAVYVRHYCQIADLYVQAVRLGLTSEPQFIWRNSRHPYVYERGDQWHKTKTRYLYADATMVIPVNAQRDKGGTWTFLLEIDRSTMTLSEMAAKFDRYLLFFGLLDTPLGDPMIRHWSPWKDLGHYLVVLCPSQARAAHLQELLTARNLPAQALPITAGLQGLLSVGQWWQQRTQRLSENERRDQREADWRHYQDAMARWSRNREEWVNKQLKEELPLFRRSREHYMSEFEQQHPRPRF